MQRLLALLALLVFSGWLAAGAAANNTPQMPQMPAAPPAPAQPDTVEGAQPPGPPPLPAPMPAPPPVPAEAAEWYYGDNGQALGPFTLTQLREFAAAGTLSHDTPVWKAGMAAWQRLGDTPELATVVAAMPKKDENQPPPPPDAQTLLNQQMTKFIIGTWRFDGPITQGGYTVFVKIEITYRPDGSYSGMQSLQMPAMGGIMPAPQISARTGRWTVVGISQTELVLTNTEYGQGAQQIGLRIIDQNTVEDTANLLRSYRIR